MRYRFLAPLTVVLFALVAIAPNAEAVDMSTSLARMDAIIKEMQALRAEFASLVVVAPTTPTGSVLGASTKSFFTQSLEVGETNSDIKKIQKLLATDPEIYPYGVASGFYGPKTEEGIKNFQSRFGMNPVGVVGPATKSLLELFFAAYPDDIYPTDVLKKKPTVLGVATSQPLLPAASVTTSQSTNPATKLTAYLEDGEADVRITFKDGTNKILLIDGDNMTEIVDGIAQKTALSKAEILAIIKFTDAGDSSDGDEDDAQEAIDDAQDDIDNVQDDIDDADSDVDTDDAQDELDDAEKLLEDAQDAFDDEDYEDAKDLAKEAQDKADDAAQELEDAEDAV